MKQIIMLIALFGAIEASAAPKLIFMEGYNFNVDLCAAGDQHGLPARAAALEAIKILEKDWFDHGQVFLEETERLLNVSFGRAEVTFSYHVCPTSADTWAPPSIQMAPLLSVLANQKQSKTDLNQTLVLMRDTIWHELLHGYIHDYFFDVESPITPLQKANWGLPTGGFLHLHLFGIQQTIYKKLNRLEDAKALRAYYERYLPEYFAGWNAVADQRPEGFVKELIDYHSSHLKQGL